MKTAEEIEYIDIPEHIKFVAINKEQTLIGLVFNHNKQVIGYYGRNNVFEVIPYVDNTICGFTKDINCKLVECKAEDLNVGDIFIPTTNEMTIQLARTSLIHYDMYFGHNKTVYIKDDNSIITRDFNSSDYKHFYKVVKTQ